METTILLPAKIGPSRGRRWVSTRLSLGYQCTIHVNAKGSSKGDRTVR